MPLLLGIAVLAMAVLLGGLAAVYRERGRRAMPAIRSFAVVAAACIALLHLLPESIAAAGWGVLGAGVVGLFGPLLLERALGLREKHPHAAPTTALAMGYAAVLAHQAGEGAALASLARTGALSAGIVLAIAAHTVPLAMVVALRVLEVRDPGKGGRRATAIALAGVAGATAAGAVAANVVSSAHLQSIEPWLLATVAGLLLHALSHDVLGAPSEGTAARVADAAAGLAGLLLATFTIEDNGWIRIVPWPLQLAGVVLLAAAIVARAFVSRASAHHHHHADH